MRKASATEVIDSAITATISRTIITHGCTLMMTVTMLLFGGPATALFRAGPDAGHLLRRVLVGVRGRRHRARWLGVKREDLVKPVKKEEQQVVP